MKRTGNSFWFVTYLFFRYELSFVTDYLLLLMGMNENYVRQEVQIKEIKWALNKIYLSET